MIILTKIFYFEMAHAIHGYSGPCKNIHGHSYELHVSISSVDMKRDYIPAPGFIIDFKDLKKLIKSTIIDKFDHKLVLSKAFLDDHSSIFPKENLILWEEEPTVENLLVYIAKEIGIGLPANLKLTKLKLHETKDSYGEWIS